jgi:dihydroorotate dehydrogenase electron transfer subunit
LVKAVEHLGSLVWLEVRVPEWSWASPGRFAMLQSQPSRCFLPRAFSVAGQKRAEGGGADVAFLIAPIGEGTNEVTSMSVGDPVWVTGPLGKGFDVDALVAPSSAPGARIVIVSGGVGAAPFPPLLDRLSSVPTVANLDVVVLMGFRDQAQARGAAPVEAAAARFAGAGGRCRTELVTEDGSCGPPRLVTSLLSNEIRRDDRVVACGPSAMHRAVWAVCSSVSVSEVWFNMETVMACGVGSCHGCALLMADGSIARVCHDGPVFRARDVYGGEVV